MDPALHPLLATPLHKEAYPLSNKTAKESCQKLATTEFTYKKRSGVKKEQWGPDPPEQTNIFFL